MSSLEEKYAQAKKVMQTWVDQQGHDRCWYYPELFLQLVEIFEMTPTRSPCLPARSEFEEGCRRYQDEEYAEDQR